MLKWSYLSEMKYLFFDIECAKCDKSGFSICEFGYVLTDERFGIVEKDHFMINPDSEFDEYNLSHILKYSKEEYEACPKFPEFYPRIAALLTDPEHTVIGHSTMFDYNFLSSECQRYELPLIDFKYYDIRPPYEVLLHYPQAVSLGKMMDELNLKKPGSLHDATVDAWSTMMVCRELCMRYSKTVDTLFLLKPKKKSKTVAKTKGHTALGDQLKAKGIDLSKLCAE